MFRKLTTHSLDALAPTSYKKKFSQSQPASPNIAGSVRFNGYCCYAYYHRAAEQKDS